MKVVAYSIKGFEKEFLAKANQRKHDITLISNPLSLETIAYATGKDAVIVAPNDSVTGPVINKLADMGIKYLTTRSSGTDHIDIKAAAKRNIHIANVPAYSPQAIAEHTVALALSLSRHLPQADAHSHHFDFRLNGLTGFNFYGKTVGLIGLGHIGLATGCIFNGLGCRVIGYDVSWPDNITGIEPVSLEALFHQADIISLHAPLTDSTKYLVNKTTLHLMKKGVMILNTSRGGLINTADALEAVEKGQIGYLGLDVYEHEKGLFFEDHENDPAKDQLLTKLLSHPNVIVTPHQAFLTNEALQQLADGTINNLDRWQNGQASPVATERFLNNDKVHLIV
jgi:D-lactate dehydrogenase